MGKHTQVGVVGSAVFAPRYLERTSLEQSLHAVTKCALRNVLVRACAGLAEAR